MSDSQRLSRTFSVVILLGIVTTLANGQSPTPLPTNVTWILESFETVGGAVDSSKTGRSLPSIVFRGTPVADGTGYGASGSTGCNAFGASYRIFRGDSIWIEVEGLTRVYCGDVINVQEERYLLALDAATLYEVSANRLRIYYEGTSKVMNFRREFPALRLVNLLSDVPSLDLHVDNVIWPGWPALPGRSAAAVVPLEFGPARLDLMAAGTTGPPLASLALSPQPDSLYNWLVLGRNGTSSTILFATPKAQGLAAAKIQVRLLNTLGGNPLRVRIVDVLGIERLDTSGIAATTFTPRIEIDAGRFVVELATEGDSTVRRFIGELAGSSVATLIPIDTTGQGGLGLFALLENIDSAQVRLLRLRPKGEESGAFRVVNMLASTSTFRFQLDRSPYTSIAYRGATSRFDDLLGTVKVVGTLVSTRGNDYFNATAQVTRDSLTTTLLLGYGTYARSNTHVVRLSTPLAPPPANETRVRLLHASPDAGSLALDLRAADGTNVLTTTLRFQEPTSYVTVPPGVAIVTIRDSGKAVVVLEAGAELPGGAFVTAIVGGLRGDSTFGVEMLIDSDSARQSPLRRARPAMELLDPTTGSFRAVNLVLGESRLRAGRDGVVPDTLRYRSAGKRHDSVGLLSIDLELLSGGDRLPVDPPRLRRDTLTTLATIGIAGTHLRSTVVLLTPVDPPPPGVARLRLFHASPDSGPLDLLLQLDGGRKERIAGLAFGSSTPYIDLPPGTLEVLLVPAGSQRPLLRVGGGLRAGAYQTAIVSGSAVADSLVIGLLVDSEPGSQSPIERLGRMAAIDDMATGRRSAPGFVITPGGSIEMHVVAGHSGSYRVAFHDLLGRRVAITPADTRQTREQSIAFSCPLLAPGYYAVTATDARGIVVGRALLRVVP